MLVTFADVLRHHCPRASKQPCRQLRKQVSKLFISGKKMAKKGRLLWRAKALFNTKCKNNSKLKK